MKPTRDKPVAFDWCNADEVVPGQPVSTPRACDLAGNRRPTDQKLPGIFHPLLRSFTWYSQRYFRKHFHSIRVSRAGLPDPAKGWPLVIYSNHASWWDPLLGLVLREHYFRDRATFAPMESVMLRRYGFFRWLGFFGVEQHTPRGAVQFLRTAQAVLQSPNNILALTPQGRFADVRERPIGFQSGLGHLALRAPRACFMPLAIEYVFWEERLPEVLVRFGPPTRIGEKDLLPANAARWTARFENALQQIQDALSAQAQRRCLAEFVELLRGDAGQGGVYDFWHCFKARCAGRKFEKEHGRK